MREELTKNDVEKIQAEIDHRILEVRPKALEDLKEARAQGDLSENFEYYAAKRFKNQNESRIRYLQNILKNAVIISDESKDDEVGINNTVVVYIPEDDEEDTFRIVTSIRSSSKKKLISIDSPLGKALLGHKVGDTVTVKVNDDYSYDLEIRSIENTQDDESLTIRSF